MIRVVLDTNVLISAALSPKGNPAKIIERIADEEEVQVYYATKIFEEYKRVLSYERLNIAKEIQIAIINTMEKVGLLIKPVASIIPLPDETDRVFYDTAKARGAILITGNIKHYPSEPFIMTPHDFLSYLEWMLE